MDQKDAERSLFTRLQILRNALCSCRMDLQEQPRRGHAFRIYMKRIEQLINDTDTLISFLSEHYQSEQQPVKKQLKMSDYIEFSGMRELRKFQDMPPISEAEVHQCDVNTLLAKLLAEPW